jgi:YggT family protein
VGIADLLQVTFLAIWLLVIGRVLMSFVDPAGRTQLGAFVIRVTEPILAPIRRALPPTGMIDLSPLVVLIVLGVLWRVI